MVNLMLDDLGRPAGEIPDVGLHLTILPLPVSYTHLDVYKRQAEGC